MTIRRLGRADQRLLPFVRRIDSLVGQRWRPEREPLNNAPEPDTGPNQTLKMKRDTQVRGTKENSRATGGFSVIELLIVMAVAGILMAIGMPSFVDFTRDVRAGSMMSTLTADIQSARSEAVKRNARILFCARATATSNSCTGAPGANVWMNGWLVCYDRDSDGACDASTAAEPNPITAQGAIQAPLAIVGPAANLIMFPTGSASAGSVFTVTGGTSVTRTATIQPSGSVVTAKSGGY